MGKDWAVRVRLYRAQPIRETFREHPPKRVVRLVENFNPLVKRQKHPRKRKFGISNSTTKPNFALPPVGRLLNANDVARRAQHRGGVETVGGHVAGDVVEEGAQVAAPLGRG